MVLLFLEKIEQGCELSEGISHGIVFQEREQQMERS